MKCRFGATDYFKCGSTPTKSVWGTATVRTWPLEDVTNSGARVKKHTCKTESKLKSKAVRIDAGAFVV